jgi:hypothetical protein
MAFTTGITFHQLCTGSIFKHHHIGAKMFVIPNKSLIGIGNTDTYLLNTTDDSTHIIFFEVREDRKVAEKPEGFQVHFEPQRHEDAKQYKEYKPAFPFVYLPAFVVPPFTQVAISFPLDI